VDNRRRIELSHKTPDERMGDHVNQKGSFDVDRADLRRTQAVVRMSADSSVPRGGE
jgi:hypothetical protein